MAGYERALRFKCSALFRIRHAVHYIGHEGGWGGVLSAGIERLISFRKRIKKRGTFTVSNCRNGHDQPNPGEKKKRFQLVKRPV